MQKEKIYIPIPVLLWDQLLVKTVNSLFTQSSGNFDLNIHVSVVGEQRDYDKVVKDLSGFNVNITRVPISIFTLGVGKGRKFAMSQYKDEDYVFQIDPHSIFNKDWDMFFVKALNDAIEFTNNKKTILTSYASRFYLPDGVDGKEVTNWGPLYGTVKFENGMSDGRVFIPMWDNFNLDLDQRKIFGARFAPSPKFNANCAFGNKEFAKYTGLHEDAIFWEEEFTQAINLFGEDFCLVFPTEYLPINHYYDGNNLRAGISEVLNNGLSVKSALYSWDKYIHNPLNQEKIKKWCDYLEIDLESHTIGNPVPNKYLNIKDKEQNVFR